MSPYRRGLVVAFVLVTGVAVLPWLWEREYVFGSAGGRAYGSFWLAFVGGAGLLIRAVYREDLRRALGSALGIVAAAFLLLSFLAGSEQSYLRAQERLTAFRDEEAALERRRALADPSDREYVAALIERAATERSARQLESRAAETRWNGDPDYFHSPFRSIALGVLAGIAALGAVECFRSGAPCTTRST